MKNIFHSNYVMAVMSIVLIVLIVAIALNFNQPTTDSSGQAYLGVVQDDIVKIDKGPGMIKVYTESAPERYAYLRDD